MIRFIFIEKKRKKTTIIHNIKAANLKPFHTSQLSKPMRKCR